MPQRIIIQGQRELHNSTDTSFLFISIIIEQKRSVQLHLSLESKFHNSVFKLFEVNRLVLNLSKATQNLRIDIP